MLLKSNHLLLVNHVVQGRPVLPAVGLFDLLFEQLARGPAVLPWKVSNAFWFNPVAVAEDALSLVLDMERTSEGCFYRVASTEGGVSTTYASGFFHDPASIAIEPVAAAEPDVRADASAIRMTSEELYAAFAKGGIDYGAPFRCIDTIDLDADKAIASLLRRPDGGRPECFPGLLDAAIQCALLWVRRRHPDVGLCVPFSIGEITVFASPGDRCACVATLRTEGRSGGYFVFDVGLTDENGQMLARIRDLCVRPYERGVETLWAVAASFTAEPLAEPLLALSRGLDWGVRVEFAPYNQLFQELLDPCSLVNANRSGANFLLIRLEDFGERAAPEARAERASAQAALDGHERYVLPNGLEIAHLNAYETRYLYEEIFLQQTYLKQGIVIEDGDVVFDIGANIGMFSLFVASRCRNARIFACEPAPETFEALRRNLALHAPSAMALPCGVGDDDRDAEFVFYPKSSVFSGFHANQQVDGHALREAMANEMLRHPDPVDADALRDHLDGVVAARLEKETRRCRLRSLSSLIREHRVDFIDLLKIDAEKCEWDILRSIEPDHWPKIRQIVVEVHDGEDGETAARVRALLRERGYDVSAVEEELLEGSRLFNLYARRAAAERPVAQGDLEKGIVDNVDDWMSLLCRTAGARRAPTFVVICPPSPAARTRLPDAFLAATEARIRARLSGEDDIHLIAMSEQAALYDWGDPHDAVRDAMGRIPYTPRFFEALASAVVRRLHCLQREPYKVIALDCDNTLWAGVAGEQGAAELDVNASFRALQAFMLEQKNSGLLLCLVSKNDLADVRRIFESRTDMPLAWSDFAACRINWDAKSANLESLAGALGLGLDSFVFLDDNPLECAEVRARCPQVLTLRLPARQEDIPGFLAHVWAFDHASRTAEDSRRTELYQQSARREAFRAAVASFAEFIDNLGLEIRIDAPGPRTSGACRSSRCGPTSSTSQSAITWSRSCAIFPARGRREASACMSRTGSATMACAA